MVIKTKSMDTEAQRSSKWEWINKRNLLKFKLQRTMAIIFVQGRRLILGIDFIIKNPKRPLLI